MITQLEKETLSSVAFLQSEDGFSEYTSVDSDSEKGVLGSLVKKGLVYDCYDNGAGDDSGTYMYCLTAEGLELCKSLEIDVSHIQFFN